MRSLTESEHDRIFLESTLEEPSMPICVEKDLDAAEDIDTIEEFPLAGEAVGWLPGRRRIDLNATVFDYDDELLHAIVAHEMGHHRGHHIFITKVWKWVSVVIALSIFFAGFVMSLFHLWLIPVFVGIIMSLIPIVMMSSGWFSRKLEFDADRRAAALLDGTEQLEALCDAESAERPEPSSLRDRFYELSYPWPTSEQRLESLRAIERD